MARIDVMIASGFLTLFSTKGWTAILETVSQINHFLLSVIFVAECFNTVTEMNFRVQQVKEVIQLWSSLVSAQIPRGLDPLAYVHAYHICTLHKTDGLKMKNKSKATVCPGSRGVSEPSERFR